MVKLRAVLSRRWPILLATLLLGGVLGALSTSLGAERGITFYQADQVLVANRDPNMAVAANVFQDSLQINRGAVPKRAEEILGESGQGEKLALRVLAAAKAESNSIKLSIVDVDPKRASAIAQAFSQAFLEVVNAGLRTEIDAQLDVLKDRSETRNRDLSAFDAQYPWLTNGDPLPLTENVNALTAERQRLYGAAVTAQQDYDNATLRAPQRPPYTTLGPEVPRVADAQLIEVPDSPIFRAGLLGIIGLLLGAALVIVIERVNGRIDTRDELAELVGVPIIAEIGKIPRRKWRGTDDGKISLDGVWSEHYRRVRSAIQFVQADAEHRAERSDAGLMKEPRQRDVAVISGHRVQTGVVPRVFLFVSALPGEGKSTSVALTAMALAETGHETLVVNADFRRPKVETYLGTTSKLSIADRAELRVDRPDLDEIVGATEYPHLWMAASGKPTIEVRSRIDVAKELAAEGAARGGTVLIDSSPLRVSNDPIDLLSAADEVILVVRAGRTTVKSIEDTMELLDQHHAPTLGVILIGTLATREMYAYYASYYQEANGQADRDEDSAAPGSGEHAVPAADPSDHAPMAHPDRMADAGQQLRITEPNRLRPT